MHATTLPVAMRVARVAHSAVRVGDPERERAAAALRHHFAAGRLETDELEQRLEQVYAARGRGDLRLALAGLPAERLRGAAVGLYGFQHRALRYHAGTWAALNGSLIGLWSSPARASSGRRSRSSRRARCWPPTARARAVCGAG